MLVASTDQSVPACLPNALASAAARVIIPPRADGCKPLDRLTLGEPEPNRVKMLDVEIRDGADSARDRRRGPADQAAGTFKVTVFHGHRGFRNESATGLGEQAARVRQVLPGSRHVCFDVCEPERRLGSRIGAEPAWRTRVRALKLVSMSAGRIDVTATMAQRSKAVAAASEYAGGASTWAASCTNRGSQSRGRSPSSAQPSKARRATKDLAVLVSRSRLHTRAPSLGTPAPVPNGCAVATNTHAERSANSPATRCARPSGVADIHEAAPNAITALASGPPATYQHARDLLSVEVTG